MSKKNSERIVIRASVLEVRLFFNTILLNLILIRNHVNDSGCSDLFKFAITKYLNWIFRSVEKLHDIFLPFDNVLDTIDTGKGSLTPICKKDVKPGEPIR